MAYDEKENGAGVAARFPVPLVCPLCHRSLDDGPDELRCRECQRSFPLLNGFADLVIGDRFDDPTDEECMLYEETSNEYTARNFWQPVLKELIGYRSGKPKLLALGCGTGIEVDLLNEVGFECVGIDCGNRTESWPRRGARDSLLLANGMSLPFEDETFDAVFCGCVFPHVGVVGDSAEVTSRYHEDRMRLAREMGRVVAPGGWLVASSPNRLFPLDIFHGRAPGSYRPRFNWPGSPFLLSLSDYRALFSAAGCGATRTLSPKGYWGFVRSQNSLKGRLLGTPLRWVFSLLSIPGLGFLRSSPLAPWIVVAACK